MDNFDKVQAFYQLNNGKSLCDVCHKKYPKDKYDKFCDTCGDVNLFEMKVVKKQEKNENLFI